MYKKNQTRCIICESCVRNNANELVFLLIIDLELIIHQKIASLSLYPFIWEFPSYTVMPKLLIKLSWSVIEILLPNDLMSKTFIS